MFCALTNYAGHCVVLYEPKAASQEDTLFVFAGLRKILASKSPSSRRLSSKALIVPRHPRIVSLQESDDRQEQCRGVEALRTVVRDETPRAGR